MFHLMIEAPKPKGPDDAGLIPGIPYGALFPLNAYLSQDALLRSAD